MLCVFTDRLISTKKLYKSNYSQTHSGRMPQIQLKTVVQHKSFSPLNKSCSVIWATICKIYSTKKMYANERKIMFTYVDINSFLERGILKLMESLECVSHRPFSKFPVTSF